jgi:hypothetical protein
LLWRAGRDRRALGGEGRGRHRDGWLRRLRLARFPVAASLGLSHFSLLLAASDAADPKNAFLSARGVSRKRRRAARTSNLAPQSNNRRRPTFRRFDRELCTSTDLKYIDSRCDEKKINRLPMPNCQQRILDDLSEQKLLAI